MTLQDNLHLLETELGYQFKNRSLLIEALRHPSLKQHKINSADYERLEFLGDSVLSFIITENIFTRHKEYQEGRLAKIRAFLVCKDAICKVAEHLRLDKFIIMTKGEEISGGRTNMNNVENATEALIAAIYLDGGIESAKKVVLNLWEELLKTDQNIIGDPKSTLQEWAQAHSYPIPSYSITSKTGPSHSPDFKVMVSIESLESQYGFGKTIKAAEKMAAEKMLANATKK